MKETSSGFESELQISVRPVIIIVMILDLLLILSINPLSTSDEQLHELIPEILVQMLLVGAWLFENRKPLVGRWLTIIGLIIIILLTSIRLNAPILMSLMVIPILLSAALINIPSAFATTIGASLLLVASFIFSTSSDRGLILVIFLVVFWITLGIMFEIYGNIKKVTQWTWERYCHAYDVLNEAQDSRAKLGQALDDLVHTNRQLALFNKRVNDYRLIAEEALQAKSDFVASVSHEFRTPLNIIIGLVELMVETPEIYDVVPSFEMHNDLKVIYRNSEHLANMINDVLDLTRAEVGYLTLHRERQDLHKIIESAMIAIRPLLENKKLTWDISAANDLPEVYCDGIRIEQVILNLMSNAARYTDEGGISVKAIQQEQRILVNIVDTGLGISSENVERIFEPFQQSKGQLGRDKGGSGLGLSISKQIVELHGGRMWVESKLGVGSTFTFELPISPPIMAVGRPGHQIVNELEWNEHRTRFQFSDSHYKPRLVIFDETGDLYNLLTHFSDEVEFVETRSLEQVVAASQQSPAHAVLLNLVSCDNLLQSVEIVKQRLPGTPIIVCSVPPKIDYADTYGVLGYLIKPVTRSDIMSAIKSVGKPVRRVLVVDDDAEVRDLFSRMLLVYDNTIEVKTVASGEEALSELKHTIPDLMLLDMLMPDMNGLQVLEAISQDKTIGEVATLIVSAQDPTGKPPTSAFLLAAMDKELSISRLLNCALDISALLLKPEGTPGQAPAETV
jgi:signal transduction histidine kinase/CheY-like chemotaxis protein